MTIKQILQNHKLAIIISVIAIFLFPFVLNWLVMRQTICDVAEKPETWIEFWPSYLSAIASFGMIALTAITLFFNSKTLRNNKEQLDEMKRQWDEEHKPNVSVSFNILNSIGSLRIVNTSIVEVKDLSVNAEFYYNGNKIEEATFPDLKTLKINIEPKGIRNVRIKDVFFQPNNDYYFVLRLNYNGEIKEPIKVSCNQIYTIGDNLT